MEKKNMKQIEEKMSLYFKYKNDTASIKGKIILLKAQIDEIESDIRETNISIKEMNEHNKDEACVENDDKHGLMKLVLRLENELQDKRKELIKLKAEHRAKEKYLKDFEYIMDNLDDIDKKFIDLKYNKKRSINYISISLNIAQSTAYRKRNRIADLVSSYFEEQYQYKLKCGA